MASPSAWLIRPAGMVIWASSLDRWMQSHGKQDIKHCFAMLPGNGMLVAVASKIHCLYMADMMQTTMQDASSRQKGRPTADQNCVVWGLHFGINAEGQA